MSSYFRVGRLVLITPGFTLKLTPKGEERSPAFID
jgi:hypothetical protein